MSNSYPPEYVFGILALRLLVSLLVALFVYTNARFKSLENPDTWALLTLIEPTFAYLIYWKNFKNINLRSNKDETVNLNNLEI